MKKTGNRKLRIRMRLILYLKDSKVLDVTKQKKSQILLQLERVPHDKGYIRVDYGVGHNDSTHLDDISLKKALSSYTELSLIKLLRG